MCCVCFSEHTSECLLDKLPAGFLGHKAWLCHRVPDPPRCSWPWPLSRLLLAFTSLALFETSLTVCVGFGLVLRMLLWLFFPFRLLTVVSVGRSSLHLTLSLRRPPPGFFK